MENQQLTIYQLLPIQEDTSDDGTIQTVNARDLYEFLGVGRDFSTWLKGRIAKFGFQENLDFVCSPDLGSKGRGGSNRIDYHLSTDMAKDLAMAESTEKGAEVRKYFKDCEKQFRLTQPALEARLAKVESLLANQQKPQKRLSAPKKEFLALDELAHRYRLSHLLWDWWIQGEVTYAGLAKHILVESGRITIVLDGIPIPTEAAKGNYRMIGKDTTRTVKWETEDFKQAMTEVLGPWQ